MNVTSSSEPTRRNDIATDLVEYLVLVIPGPHALASVGPELERIAESSAIRLLDLVVVEVDQDGTPQLLEVDSVPRPRRNPAGGRLLRRAAQSTRRRARVARLATRSLRGGAGRRGPMGRTTRSRRPRRRRGDSRRRTDLATPGRGRVGAGGGAAGAGLVSMQPATRDGIPDLLTRPPNGTREFVTEWSHLLVDPVRQLEQAGRPVRDGSPLTDRVRAVHVACARPVRNTRAASGSTPSGSIRRS